PVTPYSHQYSTSAVAWPASYRGAPQVGQDLGQEQLRSLSHLAVPKLGYTAARAHRQGYVVASTVSACDTPAMQAGARPNQADLLDDAHQVHWRCLAYELVCRLIVRGTATHRTDIAALVSQGRQAPVGLWVFPATRPAWPIHNVVILVHGSWHPRAGREVRPSPGM